MCDLQITDQITIPSATVKRFSSKDHDWLRNRPLLVASICQQHTLVLTGLAPVLNVNLVLFGESTPLGQIVLELAPTNPETANELACLRITSATSQYPGLIAADESLGWSLQQRVPPGTTMQKLT